MALKGTLGSNTRSSLTTRHPVTEQTAEARSIADTDFQNMSYDDMVAWIRDHAGMFEGMTQQEIGDWINDKWGQYQTTDQTTGTTDQTPGGAPMFGVFGESPKYNIPEEVQQQLDLYRQTAITGISEAERLRDEAMGTLGKGIEGALGEMRTAREQALGMSKEDIERIRDIQTRSRAEALQQGYAARQETLAELQRGGGRALDIMRLQAFGGLPGERMTREQMQANFAATQQAIKERAGGGAASLGAIAESYGQQLEAERQLAVDRAQYQAQGMANLAAGEMTQSQRMAEAMRQSRMDIAGIGTATAKDLSEAYLATSQYYTGQVGQYARDIADAQFRGSQVMAQTGLQAGQNVIDQAYRGTAMVGEGLQNVIGQKQQQFAINQYEPYVAQRNFLINELSRLDPFGVQAQMYGDLMGQGYSQYMQGVSGQAQSWANMANTFANTAATANIQGLYSGNQAEYNDTWMFSPNYSQLMTAPIIT